MKLFIKILLFVFVALITNVKVSATITFPSIQETTISFSFQNKTPKTSFKVTENGLANCCQNEQNLVDYRDWGVGVEAIAAKGVPKLLNQFNSAESLIQGAGNLTKVKAGMQGFVKGDGAAIFKAISQGGTRQANGTILMKDGTTLFNHFSTKKEFTQLT